VQEEARGLHSVFLGGSLKRVGVCTRDTGVCEKEKGVYYMALHTLSSGQQQARARWNTHERGAAFDRKKSPYLTQQAQDFLAQQAFCVIAGPGPHQELWGLLVPGEPGFVQTPNRSTCLLQIARQLAPSRLVGGLRQASQDGLDMQLSLCFICHPTRERLCVQGSASLHTGDMPDLHALPPHAEPLRIQVQVREAFFHCAKYIKTRVAGLTSPADLFLAQARYPQHLLGASTTSLSENIRAFIEKQLLCFLCTRNHDGQCAVNHRGGAPGFLVALPPDESEPGGMLLLPDYAGNGAFEAIGNILETEEAALVIPDYGAQVALFVSGSARVVEVETLPEDLARRCKGAERVVALSVRWVEVQYGDWSATLSYERARAQSIWSAGKCSQTSTRSQCCLLSSSRTQTL
jgi:hypothetical protein